MFLTPHFKNEIKSASNSIEAFFKEELVYQEKQVDTEYAIDLSLAKIYKQYRKYCYDSSVIEPATKEVVRNFIVRKWGRDCEKIVNRYVCYPFFKWNTDLQNNPE